MLPAEPFAALVRRQVQAFFADGAMSLHTRSLKYGKLSGGVLVSVAPSLMKRLKQHFHVFEFGVAAIFGMNGYVWVSPDRTGGAAAHAPDSVGGSARVPHSATVGPFRQRVPGLAVEYAQRGASTVHRAARLLRRRRR